MSLPCPVILVPGITATNLRDEYPLPPEIVWSVMTRNYERSALHPDDLRYELKEPARVKPDQLFEVAYRELVDELRDKLSPNEDEPVPVYPFGYDWRQNLAVTEARLNDFIEEVIDRTMLLRHYRDPGDDYAANPKINLVGHSMGGLVIAGYLERFGDRQRVNKVATLATPFRGSLEAPLKITTGTADLGTGSSSARERHTARLTPALYQLLPSFDGAVIPVDDAPDNLFETGAWQPSVIDTLTDFIRRNGLDPTDPREQALGLFTNLLDGASTHRQRVENLDLTACGLDENDWLCVAGVNSKTRVRLQIRNVDGAAEFVLDPDDRQNKWESQTPGERILTGDGTVPYLGALNGFIPIRKVVCITPDDYGYWEVQDRVLSAVAGFHGILPNMNMLHRLIARFFTGADDPHGATWGRRAPNIPDGEDWEPPLDLAER